MMTAREGGGARSHGLRSLLWPGVFALLALALLVSLGMWQWQRLQWKEALLAQISTRIDAEPAPLPLPAQWNILARPEHEYMRVRLSGVFDHAHEMLIFRAAGAGLLEPGYHVVTPLRLVQTSGLADTAAKANYHVLVNRGFVPERLKAPNARAAGQISGEVTLTGHIRSAEARGTFTPPDTPDKGVWYTRDPVMMAAHLKLANAAPFVIDADGPENPGGWPKPGTARVQIPNNHLSYALTWFGLALTLIGVFGVFAFRRLRGRS